MLISRFNGVAWYHEVDTIARYCEKQVVFPVGIGGDGPPDIARPSPGRTRVLARRVRCCTPKNTFNRSIFQTRPAPKTADREDAIPPRTAILAPSKSKPVAP